MLTPLGLFIEEFWKDMIRHEWKDRANKFASRDIIRKCIRELRLVQKVNSSRRH